MKPVIALVGRPNVGKSTLYNCFTRSRDALVADQPGLTRDRKYGEGEFENRQFIVIDTGGLNDEPEAIENLMAEQAWLAIDEADFILFLTDARDGLVVGDEEIANRLRRTGKPVTLVVNKTDGLNADVVQSEFYALGLGEPVSISASHRRGISGLLQQVLIDAEQQDTAGEDQPSGIKVAIVGKPNAGKSTLVNRILGEERVLAFDLPGTTRDSIYIPFKRQEQDYVLIDTAGVRRRGRINDKLEKFSVIKSLQAIEQSNVVVLVIDAHEGITDQDSHLLGYIIESGRALLIAVNKWDGLQESERERVKYELQRKLQFCEYAKIFFISALHGTGVGELYAPIIKAYQAATINAATSRLTRILEDAVEAHQPPLVRGRRIKLRYAHQGGKNPPIIVIHGNQTEKVPLNYRRYLINCFIEALQLEGTPVRIDFKTSDNPYKGKRNVLTKSQVSKKQRLRKHARRSGKK